MKFFAKRDRTVLITILVIILIAWLSALTYAVFSMHNRYLENGKVSAEVNAMLINELNKSNMRIDELEKNK